MQTPSFAVLIASESLVGTGYVGTSVGKLMRGEHNNDARSGEAKKGQLSEAEGESRSFSTDGSGRTHLRHAPMQPWLGSDLASKDHLRRPGRGITPGSNR